MGLGLALAVVGCGQKVTTDQGSEGKIGDQVQPVAVAAPENGKGVGPAVVGIFDETTRKVRLFDLASSRLERAFDVIQPAEKHTLQYHPAGNYLLDVSKKYLTIHSRDGASRHHALFSFAPAVSSAFLPDKNLLIYFNENKTVFVLRIDPQGNILANVPFGGDLGADGTIVCGDVNAAGELVVGLSKGDLAVIDIDASLAAKEWKYRRVAAGLTEVAWMAPLRDRPRSMIVKSLDTISVIDIDTAAVSAVSIKGQVVERYSRQLDPHILVRSGERQGSDLLVYWVDQGVIATKKLSERRATVLRSFLDVTGANRWVFAETAETQNYVIWRDPEEARNSRRVLRYEWKQLLNSQDVVLADGTQVEVTPSFVFALYPYRAGYAVWRDLNTDEEKAIKGFNIGDL